MASRALCWFVAAVSLGGGAPVHAGPLGGLQFCVGPGGWRLSSDFESGARVVASPRGEQHARLDGMPASAPCADGGRPRALPDGLEIQFEGGRASQRSAAVIVDPADAPNHVLRFDLKEANVADPGGRAGKGRVQLNAYGFPPAKTVWMSVRLRLSPSFNRLRALDRPFQWLTISEWWNNPSWAGAPYPFRVTLNVVKIDAAVGAPLRLAAHGQTYDAAAMRWKPPEWTATSTDFELPVDQWVTLETHMIEGAGSSGRYRVSVVGEGGARKVVLDVSGATHHPDNPAPVGFSHINPVKLYTAEYLVDRARASSGALSIDWDDLDLVGCGGPDAKSARNAGSPPPCYAGN